MRKWIVLVFAVAVFAGCARVTIYRPAAPLDMLATQATPAPTVAQATVPTPPPATPAQQSAPTAQVAPAPTVPALPLGRTKWKTFQAVVWRNEGNARFLQPIDGFQSRDILHLLGNVPVADLPCEDSPENPDAGYYSSVLVVGVSPKVVGGVVKLNHVVYRVGQDRVIQKHPDGTITLALWVRMCGGQGDFSVPRDQLNDKWCAAPRVTLWWGVPPKFRERIIYPFSDAHKQCRGDGSDADLCGKPNWRTPVYGEFCEEAAHNAASVFSMKAR